MIDFRTFVLVLCAVFLFFGFGILVGVSMIGPAQVRQQTEQLKVLKSQVNTSIQETQASRDITSKMEDAVEQLRPSLVGGVLSGRRVIVIQTSDADDAARNARATLADAGADVAIVTINDSFMSMTADQRAAVYLAAGIKVGATDGGTSGNDESRTDDGSGSAPLFRALANALALGTIGHPGNARLIELLERRQLISASDDLTGHCGAFVIAGGSHDDLSADADADTTSTIDMPLIDALDTATSREATIVGCEPFDTTVSYVAAYQKENIATVDCIDLPLGKLDLPFAVRGGADSSDYGVKSTAKRRIPVSLEVHTTQ